MLERISSNERVLPNSACREWATSPGEGVAAGSSAGAPRIRVANICVSAGANGGGAAGGGAGAARGAPAARAGLGGRRGRGWVMGSLSEKGGQGTGETGTKRGLARAAPSPPVKARGT